MNILLPCRPLFTAEQAHERYRPNYEGRNFVLKSISRRLEQLETANRVPFRDVLLLIDAHRYYDELTEEQKERFCAYAGEPRADVEAEAYELLNDLHFMLMKITQGESRKGNNK